MGQFPQIYNNLSWVYNIMGDYEKSEKAIRKAIELLPLNEYGYRILGDLKYFYKYEQADNAIPYFQKCIQVGGNYNLGNLANLYIQTGQLDSAEITIKIYEKVYPQSTYYPAFLRAKIYLQEGNIEAVKTALNYMESQLPVFDKAKENHWTYFYKTFAAIQERNADSLPDRIEVWRKETEDNPAFFFEVARAFGNSQDIPKALDWLELAFQHGWKPPFSNSQTTFRTFSFMEVRKSKRFKRLVKKYFPEEINL